MTYLKICLSWANKLFKMMPIRVVKNLIMSGIEPRTLQSAQKAICLQSTSNFLFNFLFKKNITLLKKAIHV